MKSVSIIIPVQKIQNEALFFVERINDTLTRRNISYEIIFVCDANFTGSHTELTFIKSLFPVKLVNRRGRTGQGFTLRRGFMHAKYPVICTLPFTLQYSPEIIPDMIERLAGSDIIVARTKSRGIVQKSVSRLFGFRFNVESGLKVFKKEIVERLNLESPIFDLEFLVRAREAGYNISVHDIKLANRFSVGEGIYQFYSRFDLLKSALALKLKSKQIIPFHPHVAKKKGEGFHYNGKEFVHYSSLSNDQSAFYRFSGVQLIFLASIAILVATCLIADWHRTLVGLIATFASLYFLDLFFNLYLIVRSFKHSSEIQVSKSELAELSDRDLPKYTILCPLYKEWMVIPQFVEAMKKLDYPAEKLQIMFLLEEDDIQTRNFINKNNLPSYFETVVVPHSFPKTKPKACNYGLLKARGELIVIFDAEDQPEPEQLKKAVLAFRKQNSDTACIQAKLNFYNPHQNILTRAFTAEYSLWFDLVLTGLQSIKAPIPLGGTSNHFKTEILRELKGWDAFNVTEDADLGMRIAKKGYQTAIVNSLTLEEANSNLANWFWQRTRWIKGYMQTYLLHMRQPAKFESSLANPDLLSFQFIIGGKVLSMFVNPFMWVLTIMYFVFRANLGQTIESFFPAPILYIAIFSLLVGNFLYLYYYMIGCARHGHFDLVKYALLVPFYWLLMSAAAWVALYKLITAPHYWSKTKHGLHLAKNKNIIINRFVQNDISVAKPNTVPGSIPSLSNLMKSI